MKSFVVEAGTNILSGLIASKVSFESRSLTKSPQKEWLYAGEAIISPSPAGNGFFAGKSAEAIAGMHDMINSVAARKTRDKDPPECHKIKAFLNKILSFSEAINSDFIYEPPFCLEQ